jgi:hypothetical protein
MTTIMEAALEANEAKNEGDVRDLRTKQAAEQDRLDKERQAAHALTVWKEEMLEATKRVHDELTQTVAALEKVGKPATIQIEVAEFVYPTDVIVRFDFADKGEWSFNGQHSRENLNEFCKDLYPVGDFSRGDWQHAKRFAILLRGENIECHEGKQQVLRYTLSSGRFEICVLCMYAFVAPIKGMAKERIPAGDHMDWGFSHTYGVIRSAKTFPQQIVYAYYNATMRYGFYEETLEKPLKVLVRDIINKV